MIIPYMKQEKWISKTKSEEFKYPCCYTITIKDQMKCYYSSEKKGHFDTPKVIWSNGLGTYPIIDENGEYGQHNLVMVLLMIRKI